jgi:spore cortex biosynthesis protein YabQ
MFFETQGQFLEFLACLFGGILIGLSYDILHGFDLPKIKPWLAAALDIVFAALAAGTFIVVTYLSNFGEIRPYVCIGFAAGFAAEQITLKKLVAKIARNVYNAIIKATKPLRARLKRKKPRKQEGQNDGKSI